MPLKRNVMMPDGQLLGWHVIVQIVHTSSMTRLEVESYKDEQHETPIPGMAYYTTLEYDQDTSLTFDAAYQLLADNSQFVEYVDEAQAALDEVLPILTDEQAEQVIDAFPAWQVGKKYENDIRVRYESLLYKCIQAHTSQADWTPDVAVSLWVRVGEPGEIPEWVQPTGAHDAYAKGDKVRHGGKVWTSLVDSNVWEPGAVGTESLWSE